MNSVPQGSIGQLGDCSVLPVTVTILVQPATLKLVPALGALEMPLEIIVMNVSLGLLAIHQMIYPANHASVMWLNQSVF